MDFCLFFTRAARCLILLSLLAATAVRCKDDGYANSPTNNCLDNEDHSDWMANIPSRARLFRDLTLPGTHDSGSFRYIGLDEHRDQCSSIKAQLKAGVRVFDMRLAATTAYEPGWKVPRWTIALLHGTTITTAVTFVEVWNEMTEFLAKHPTEVIVAIVRQESGMSWNEAMVKERFNRPEYSKYRDTSCLSADCAIGPSRGKIVYLGKDKEMSFLGAMDYYRVVSPLSERDCNLSNSDNPNLEDHYKEVTIRSKWDYVRAILTRASLSDTQSHGFITYLSAADVWFTYYYASGRSSPLGPAMAYAHGASCKSENRAKYYMLYHRDCTCKSNEEERFCMLQYKGLNTLLYEWINNGLEGHLQHPTEAYVFPRHLGIVLMDFPSNSLIRRLIDVNSAVQPSPPPASERFPVCGPKCSCMAGDALINTRDRGSVAASNLTLNDLVEGVKKDSWCKVLNVTRMSSGTVYGEFTADHLLWHDNGTVLPNGNGGNATARVAQLTNMLTECPAARTAKGTAFTPISTIFCNDGLSTSEYTAMYAALMRIVKRTGTFWFDPSIYVNTFVDASQILRNTYVEDDIDADLRGPQVTETFTMKLPSICRSLTSCVVNNTGCDAFEAAASQWMAKHLPASYYNKVQTLYPQLGMKKVEGTLVEDVLGLEMSAD